MKKLLMITNYFPYGNDTGEIYLRNEIFKLSEKFDSITIFSCDACKNDKLFSENLPDNVTPIPLEKKKKKFKRRYPLKTLYNMIGKKDIEVKKEWKSKKGFLKHTFLSYFLSKSQDRIKKIISTNILKECKNSDSLVIYSYRLFDLAYIGLKIKEKLINQYGCNNIKIISRAHRYDLYENKNKLNYLPLREFLLDSLDKVFPCSKDGEIYLKKSYPQYSNKISCFYLGSKDYNFTLLPIQNNSLEIVSCSTVIPVKRVQMISEVIRNLSSKIKVHWTHIGTGKEFKKLKSACSDLIDKGIITLVGSLNHEEVLKFYQSHHFDLFINLSLSEGLPQAIMEAISFGIPVLATNVGGNSEIVIENITGILVQINESIYDIEKRILLFQKNSDIEIIKLRKNCRKFWEDNFNSNVNIVKFTKELERL